MAKFKVGDKVRILDGSKIKNYTGSWSSLGSMDQYVGTIQTIKSVNTCWDNGRVSYRMEDAGYIWDERGLELATVEQKIVITTDGKTTKARLYNGKQFVRQAIARCAPDDTFNFNYGAALALSRLNGDIAEAKKIKCGKHADAVYIGEAKSFDWDGFKAGKFNVVVNRDNIDGFLKECEEHSINWPHNKATEWNPIKRIDAVPDFIRAMLKATLNFESTDKCDLKVEDGNLRYSFSPDITEKTVIYD